MSYIKGIADRINGVEKQGFTQELDINLLVPSQNNFYGIREIEELAESIKENGLMHNLVVRKLSNGTYEVISGERRLHATKLLGYKTLPCKVKEINDLDAEIMLIQANVAQRELLPTEKMEGIKRLKAVYEQKKANGEELPKGKLRDIIGQDMNLSGVQVGRYQKVDKDLIPDLKEKLDKEEITLTQAHTLSSLSEAEQEIIHEEIKALDPKESKEEVEILINGIKQPVESDNDKKTFAELYLPKVKKKSESELNSFESRLEELKKLMNSHEKVKLVIDDFKFSAMLNIKEFAINYRTLEFYLEGQRNVCKIIFQDSDPNQFKRVEEIHYAGGKIEPKAAFKITFDTYLWFKN
ncbi:chromosome-partitioning protein Spo0J [Clostridium puniceum]|uniref:Chromosome-partitioning protein Spo0J n=1 Tax=Clostridium puniceum TaxID=29367 RepID=A0A1S8TVN1_9CLOT|nr:ParB/RepB/Spo0J family partition protein [Clostridium puniceum]OOM81758.1 chromosome-partitioning protein Spo0J [Clostridium puniceum]